MFLSSSAFRSKSIHKEPIMSVRLLPYLVFAAVFAGCDIPDRGFARLDSPLSVTVDGRDAAGEVELGADGVITIDCPRPFSRVVLEWPLEIFAEAKMHGSEFERTYGDNGWYAPGQGPRGGEMPWYCMIAHGGRVDGYGVAVQPNVFASWRAGSGRLTLSLDCRAGSCPVELGGRTLKACRLVSRRGIEGESAFAAGREFCRMMCPSPRLPAGPVYGYNDWYCAYGRNTAVNFLADAAFIVSLVEGERVRPYIVVDDGWQLGKQGSAPAKARNRWTGSNEKWGMPMDELARRIRAMDARPGLWYRPFLPDDGLKNEGIPVDPTAEGLEARIRADIARFVEWGYEMLKIDFITFDWCGTWGMDYAASPVVRDDLPVWRDRSRTSAEVAKGLYAAMREAAGDKAVIIGCNALDHFAAGLFELQRTGDDTSGREWARTRKMGPNTLGMRSVHDGIFYRVDGDCFGLSEAGAVAAEKNLQWLDLIARSGTALFVSWKRELTTPESREALEKALRRAARVQPLGEPLDWQETLRPAQWRFGEETVEYRW